MKTGLKIIRLDSLKENNQTQNYPSYNYLASNNKHQIMRKILKEAQVVCCTCLDASSEKGFSFLKVIIDDAHKIPEALTLAPLLKKCHQLVLIGDSRESVCFSDKIVSISKGFNISLFNRLINRGVQKFELNLQYQTDASIVKISSELFQTNHIALEQENKIDLWLYGLKWPNFATRILFINVKGNEQLVNGSLQNLE